MAMPRMLMTARPLAAILLLTWTLTAPRAAGGGPDQPVASANSSEQVPRFEPINDPIEPFNRVMSGLNHGIIRGIVWPFTWVWQVVPERGRRHLAKAGENLGYPTRLLANLLQAKWKGAATETGRFLVNTTVGLVGFFDPAAKLGWEPYDEDFGQAFGKWGFDFGFYLVLPLLGPNSGRDGFGSLFDMASDPRTYIPGAGTFFNFNNMSFFIDDYFRFVESQNDPYTLARDLWATRRIYQVTDFAIPDNAEHDSADTIAAVFFRPSDSDFIDLAETHKVRLRTTGKKLPYELWLQPQPAPVVFILGGVGAHRLSDQSVALAEMAWREGFSAVTISSPMSWEFIKLAGSTALPGYTPVDAHDVHHALTAVWEDLLRRHEGRFTSKALMGLSLGGLHTLFIAAGLESGDEGVTFDRFVAINPPADVAYAVESLDAQYHAPLMWPAAERLERMERARLKAAALSEAELDPEEPLPLDRLESQYLIGLAFRMTLRDTIYASQRKQNLGVLRHGLGRFERTAVYGEIDQYSFNDYIQKFIIPYYVGRRDVVRDAEDLIETANLWGVRPGLANNPRVRVFVNANDFLLRDPDLQRLEDLFGTRLHVFPRGGHIGNMFHPDVQDRIMLAFRELTEAAPAGAEEKN